MTQKWKINQTTSNIYKLYINGKLKRQGTHQYPYLGSKVLVVAEKPDLTIGQPSFRRIFQTVRNLRKKDHENEFKGSKNGGREVWVGLEWPKNREIRRPKVAVAASFACPIWARPAAVRRNFWPARLPYLALPL